MIKKMFLASMLFCVAGVGIAQNNALYSLENYKEHGFPNGKSAHVVANEDGDVLVTVFDGTKVSQLINVGYVDINTNGASDVEVVRFADVNFDGYPDILVGKEGPRCGIAPVIFNSQTKKFDYELDGVILQNPLFDPVNKVIYSHAPSSAAQYYITRVFPSETRLIVDRSLCITHDVAGFNQHSDPEFRVHHKYDIIDANEKYMNEGWNDKASLPAEWQRALKWSGVNDW